MKTNKKSRLEKAILIVQATKAWMSPPEPRHPLVLKTLKLSSKEIEELYTWAQGAMSAMRWNTLTLGK